MTDQQMEKYLKSVARRLNLPKDVKTRVMSDFTSSIEARREAGMTDDAIFAELGDAKKAAADLNEQMKEFAYRKSPWRYIFAGCAVLGGVELLGSVVSWLLYLATSDPYFAVRESASVGIIGGADGPTAIFVTGLSWASSVIPALMLLIGIWGFSRLCKCKQK